MKRQRKKRRREAEGGSKAAISNKYSEGKGMLG